MRTLTSGTVHVFTFKDPSRLLSPIAHDLRLSCPQFEVTLDDDGRVRGWFRPDAIAVDGPVKGGRVDAGAFGALESGKIRSAVQKDVLRTKQHPEIVFAGTLEPGDAGPEAGGVVKGGLTMVGRTVDVAVPVRFAEGRARGRVELTPSRWGIKPYKALLGALVVADRVVVEFDLALP